MDGNVVDKDAEDSGDEEESDESDSEGHESDVNHPLPVGTRVRGNYRAAEQYGGQESWYDGKITSVHEQKDGSVKYDVEYDDGDFEENMIPKNVRPVEKSQEEKEKLKADNEIENELSLKRKMAKEKAR